MANFNYRGTTVSGVPQQPRNVPRGVPGTPSSTQAQAQPFHFDEFRDFGDSVFQEYQRTTAPELDRRREQLEQRLLSKGFQAGTEGYEREHLRFGQLENDLFNQAQQSALAQGLAAQNQAFNQSLGQAGINAGLEQARIGANSGVRSASIGAGASRDIANINNEGSLERLMASLGEQGRQFDSSHALAGQNLDFNQLMQILGIGQSQVAQNNQALSNDFGRSSSLFGLLPTGGYNPIDITGAYGINQNAQASNAANAQSGSNAGTAAAGGIAAAGIALI